MVMANVFTNWIKLGTHIERRQFIFKFSATVSLIVDSILYTQQVYISERSTVSTEYFPTIFHLSLLYLSFMTVVQYVTTIMEKKSLF